MPILTIKQPKVSLRSNAFLKENSAPEFPLKLICKIMNMRCVIECHHTKHIIFYPILRLIRSALCFSLQIPTCPRIPVLSLSCRSKITQERDKTQFVKRERERGGMLLTCFTGACSRLKKI